MVSPFTVEKFSKTTVKMKSTKHEKCCLSVSLTAKSDGIKDQIIHCMQKG